MKINKIIIGVVLIFSVIFLIGCGKKESSDSKYKQAGIDFLNSQGIEVIDLVYNLNDGSVILKMKSFGRLDDQVDLGFIFLEQWYPIASVYKIQVSSNLRDCYYEVDADVWKNISYRIRTKNDPNYEAADDLRMILNSGVCN